MRLGIVGHEQAKFTPQTEALARDAIEQAIDAFEPDAIVSGHCPLGGVDIYAEEAAAARGIEMVVHAPRVQQWGGTGGYKWRNLRIAKDSSCCASPCVACLRRSPVCATMPAITAPGETANT